MVNTMVGLRASITVPHSHSFPSFPSSLSLKPQSFFFFFSPKPNPFLTFANNNNELKEQPPNASNEQQQEEEQKEKEVNDWRKQRRAFLGFNWRTLLDPDPDNVLALGLTGILTWASVQVLWQLLFISFAILVAALKYSFIAALLLFILIALL